MSPCPFKAGYVHYTGDPSIVAAGYETGETKGRIIRLMTKQGSAEAPPIMLLSIKKTIV